MKESDLTPRQAPGIVARKTDDGYILVPVTGNIADMSAVYTLNNTGAFIWDAMDGKRSIAEIAQMVTSEFEIDDNTAMDDVSSFLVRLKEYLIME